MIEVNNFFKNTIIAKKDIDRKIGSISQEIKHMEVKDQVPEWLISNKNLKKDLELVTGMNSLRAVLTKHGSRFLLTETQFNTYANQVQLKNKYVLQTLLR